MVVVRKGRERGSTQVGWLDSRHSFCFGDYYDPQHLRFRALRVLNDDRIAPRAGFATHPHREVEILLWILAGELQVDDCAGGAERLRPGDLQRVTAGTGIRHREQNPSTTDPLHLLQIWLVPERCGLAPSAEKRSFAPVLRDGRLQRLAARDGRDGAVTLHADAELFAARLPAGASVVHALAPGRGAWLQVARGELRVNGQRLVDGDGAAITEESDVVIAAESESELLLFDLA